MKFIAILSLIALAGCGAIAPGDPVHDMDARQWSF